MSRRFGALFEKWRILRGDKVKIIAGKDKGETGTIARVLRSQNRVIVEGLNLVRAWMRAPPLSRVRHADGLLGASFRSRSTSSAQRSRTAASCPSRRLCTCPTCSCSIRFRGACTLLQRRANQAPETAFHAAPPFAPRSAFCQTGRRCAPRRLAALARLRPVSAPSLRHGRAFSRSCRCVRKRTTTLRHSKVELAQACNSTKAACTVFRARRVTLTLPRLAGSGHARQACLGDGDRASRLPARTQVAKARQRRPEGHARGGGAAANAQRACCCCCGHTSPRGAVSESAWYSAMRACCAKPLARAPSSPRSLLLWQPCLDRSADCGKLGAGQAAPAAEQLQHASRVFLIPAEVQRACNRVQRRCGHHATRV